MSTNNQEKVTLLLNEFIEQVELIVAEEKLRKGVVRSNFDCNIQVILEKDFCTVIAEKQFGTPTSIFIEAPSLDLSTMNIYEIAQWDIGFEKPFVIRFPVEILAMESSKRKMQVMKIAQSHVKEEISRVMKLNNIIQINPIFGQAIYTVDERMVFTLMPFDEELTEIYNKIVKPTVEKNHFVCKRADDIKSNKVVIQDIWKSICEARFIIADLTQFNPNVMYELGIAHTVGKETILIYQNNKEKPIKFPFDLLHIRRIEYENNAIGGKSFEETLDKTIKQLICPETFSKE